MTDWFAFLSERGARLAADGLSVSGFARDCADGEQASVLCDGSAIGLLSVTGEDAQGFLQGQVTCDVREVAPDRLRRGALCSPKGRVLATFRLWAEPGGYCLALPDSLLEPIRRRLGMYVLRARVRIAEAPAGTVRLGVAGPAARGALARALAVALETLPAVDRVMRHDGACVVGLPGARFLVCAGLDTARALWTSLATDLVEAGSDAWNWRALQAGDADVLPSTQEQFVPQMLNLDLQGGIGFAKGCYTGQEIVARTQHLGRLKQRLYRCTLPAGPVPAAGTPLYSRDFEGQASGTVLAAACGPDGATIVLAVLRVDTVQAGLAVHCGSPEGPVLAAALLVDGDASAPNGAS